MSPPKLECPKEVPFRLDFVKSSYVVDMDVIGEGEGNFRGRGDGTPVA